MADDKLQQKLADYVEDAHAMEQNDLRMIDSMISTTDDPQMKEMLETHKRETEEHERRLRERLDAMGRGTSARKQAQAVGAALLKGVGDVARGDKAGKNVRDGYTAEHMEIAAYQLLERLAEKAGDTETAEVARQNRADEEEMARRIDQSWDRALELTLEENNISTGAVSGVTDTVGDTVGGVTGTVGGATDSARGVTDDLLGGGEKRQR